MRLMISCLVTAFLLAGCAFAQELPTPASDVAPIDEEHARILLVVPAFGVTNLRQAPPMTSKHKLDLAARQAFDPFVWVSAGVQAAASRPATNFRNMDKVLGDSGSVMEQGCSIL